MMKERIIFNKDSNREIKLIEKNNQLSMDGTPVDITIETDDLGFTWIHHGSLRYQVDIVNKHQNDYELIINGVTYNFSVETDFSLQRKLNLQTQASESSIIRLKAPMPGKILDVLVKTGDIVKTGDTLLILEAMKMQNAILANTKGVVKKVLVKKGDNTSKSDLLIEIEKD